MINFKRKYDLSSLEISGKRIILKSIDEKYAQDIFKEFTPEITRYMMPKPAEHIEETLSFINESVKGMQESNEIVLVILVIEDGEFLGVCGLHGKENPETPELGIWLKKDAHGNKYGREAISALYSWACENVVFDYLIYPVDKANTASRKIPETLGGVIIEEKKVKTMKVDYLDEVVYKINSK